MQITQPIKGIINEELSSFFKETIEIESCSKLHGGSVNYCYLLNTNKGAFFIKLNSASRFPQMFELEIQGLNLINTTNSLKVPDVIAVGSYEETAYLVLEGIESVKDSKGYWENFGYQLAKMHQTKQVNFGLSYPNYIGSLPQQNNYHMNWATFFGEERILAQAKTAFDKKRIDKALLKNLECLAQKANQIFPVSTASLLHGDLWSGNFIVGKNETPIVIDPAIYYGNREMDIAMTLLFGGFNKRFYEAYNEVYPLKQDWEKRVDLCNAYPLLVHVNLFGTSYSSRLKSAIKRYL